MTAWSLSPYLESVANRQQSSTIFVGRVIHFFSIRPQRSITHTHAHTQRTYMQIQICEQQTDTYRTKYEIYITVDNYGFRTDVLTSALTC